MKALKWINTGAFVSMIVVNALAELLPLGGKTTGQVSEAYPNLFTPAPVTFSIWGLIYLLMLLFVIYQWGILDGGRHSVEIRDRIGLWFAFSCALNIMWICLWHSQLIGPSTVCIALLLVVLNVIVSRLRDNRGDLLQRTAVYAGFSLYYGWIIAATIANVSVFLTQLGWDGWGIAPEVWTAAVLLIGTVIAGAVALVGRNKLAALAVMWAYGGILLRHISPAWYGGMYPFVISAGFISELLILGTILFPGWLRLCRRWTGASCELAMEQS